MQGGIAVVARGVARLSWRLGAWLTRPFRINYGMLLAVNTAVLRTLTRFVGQSTPHLLARVEHALGLDRTHFAGPAQMGRPGTRLGMVVCSVIPLALFIPSTGLTTLGNWVVRRWPIINQLFDGEYRRRHNNQKK